ncbi:MAG: DUF1840 domain-containing protein, partial [Betaproteobacteria bacterium]
EPAQRLFRIVGKDEAPRGVITAAQVPDALARLQAAVDEEKAQLKEAAAQAEDTDRPGDDPAQGARAITLGQRAFPLLEMLRAAQKENVDVTWGV